MELDTPIMKLTGIGEAVEKKLSRLKIFNLGDLLFHLPRHWDDFSNPIPVGEVKLGERNLVQAVVKQIKNEQSPRRRMIITKAIIGDDSGELEAVWFNRLFLSNFIKSKTEWIFSGIVDHGYKGKILMNSPDFEKTKGIYSVYHETQGLNSKYLRKILFSLLNKKIFLDDFAPHWVLQKYNLTGLQEAIKSIHFPASMDDVEKAKERLAFDELFLLSLRLQLARQRLRSLESYVFTPNKEKLKEFVFSLPFKLTKDQGTAIKEIIIDLHSPAPMNRILQGEVGSGKTIVALMASLVVACGQTQTAWLAPTEILAAQHFKNAMAVLKNCGIKIGLLTGNEAVIAEQTNDKKITKNKFKKIMAEGELDLIIGTHALIQKDIEFKKLGLVIIDEQHRFGVDQRAKLRQADKTTRKIPHFLSMTATPIPRTLALSIYGDLDISTIKELPLQRKKIVTKIVPPNKRKMAYEFIRKEIQKGRQVFVICPLIEPKDATQAKKKKTLFIMDERKAVTAEYEKLSKNVFPELKIGFLHGKMKAQEKEEVMNNFRDRKLDILVSTSVVEVGIDIPNASVMMIEGAERFGLAQLHQFRGRVGRGHYSSYCFLFTSSGNPFQNRRLRALAESNDGFALAEKDLYIRGPGELAGQRQSGIPDLKMASLTDTILVGKAAETAKQIVGEGIEKYPALLKQIKKYQKERHLE